MDSHALSFVIRWVHVVSTTLLLGGAGLIALLAARGSVKQDGRAWLKFAEGYEGWFWLALGIQVLTGVGNLGAFGAALPTSDTAWGTRMMLKLGAVLIFVLFSLLRTTLIVLFDNAEGIALRAPLSRFVTVAYASTALILVAVLWLAMALAHG